MLLIKTKVKSSPIEGLGLFADEDIKQGELIWRYDADTSAIFSQQQLSTLLKSTQNAECLRYYLTYGWFVEKLEGLVVCLDNGRFFNHSPQPNSGQIHQSHDTWQYSFALRDIEKGEELTENYNTYDSAKWLDELNSAYKIFNGGSTENSDEALEMMVSLNS